MEFEADLGPSLWYAVYIQLVRGVEKEEEEE
jgi:hypothetical protein